MQILLDKFTCTFLNAYMIYIFVFCGQLYFLVFPVNFPPLVAQLLFYLMNITFTLVLLWLLVVIIVKYLTIFHLNHVNFDMTDSEIRNQVHIFVLLISGALFFIEHIFLSELEENGVYCLLAGIESDDGNQGLLKTIKMLIVLIITAVVVLQIQIERKGLNRLPSDNGPGKPWIRFFAVLIISFLAFLVIIVTRVTVQPNTQKVFRAWVILIGKTIPIPLFFVLTNKKIRNFIMECTYFNVDCKCKM